MARIHVGRHRAPGFSPLTEIADIATKTASPAVEVSAVAVASGGLVAAFALPAAAASANDESVAASDALAVTAPQIASQAVAVAALPLTRHSPVLRHRRLHRQGGGPRGASPHPDIQGRSHPCSRRSRRDRYPCLTYHHDANGARHDHQAGCRPQGCCPRGPQGGRPHRRTRSCRRTRADRRHHRHRREPEWHPVRVGWTTTAGFDCSGYTGYVYRQVGKSIPRTAEAQRVASTKISNPVPGDLIFFGYPAYHVGIYAGAGKMYASSRPGTLTGLGVIWTQKDVSYGRF